MVKHLKIGLYICETRSIGDMKGIENSEKSPVMMRKSHRAYMIERILQELEIINNRVENLEKRMASKNMELLKFNTQELYLPEQQLIDTYIVVVSRGECDAQQVAQLTGRSRSTESNYLNQLYREGWIDKAKIAKTTRYFPLQTI